jgi:predicted ferric reductase
MSLGSKIYSLIKKLSIIILIISIIIPLRYVSTNLEYLRVRCFHSLLSLTYKFIIDEDRPNSSSDYRAFKTLCFVLNH